MNDIITNLQRHYEFLADPKLNGRVPGQEGNRLARVYIQQQFQPIGLTTLFDGNWFQEYKTLASGRDVIGVNVGGQIKGLLADDESPIEVAPDRNIIDLIISEIKSKYLRRHD